MDSNPETTRSSWQPKLEDVRYATALAHGGWQLTIVIPLGSSGVYFAPDATDSYLQEVLETTLRFWREQLRTSGTPRQ